MNIATLVRQPSSTPFFNKKINQAPKVDEYGSPMPHRQI